LVYLKKLGVVDDFRTANWLEIVKYPELVYQKSMQLLSGTDLKFA